MIKSEKYLHLDGSVTYYLFDNSKVILEYTVAKGMDKGSIFEAYNQKYSDDAVYNPAKLKKKVMQALGKVDNDLQTQYRLTYPWGGKRTGSGRKRKSHNKRTNRTEKLRNSITIEEKNLLKVVLKYYRENIATADSKIKEDFDINILRQLT